MKMSRRWALAGWERYRARDTRLERMVAIKLLNSALAASPDLKARFEREAKVISQHDYCPDAVIFVCGNTTLRKGRRDHDD